MKFRLELNVKKLPVSLTHQQKILLMGSCFTENIGEKLDKHKFNTLQNPHGILFNPVSVAEALLDCIDAPVYKKEHLFPLNEGWHSWKHHSRYSHPQPTVALQKINASIQKAHAFLQEADVLFLTLGSAWVYRFTPEALQAKTGAVSANNHKAPASWFQRSLLSTEEVLQALDNILHRLFLFNPKLQIIFTISPVRHLREGLVDNNRSKATLIQAVHHLVDKFEKLYYFPAYELVIDDLRDYRYYSEDLVHPNYFATQYVWEKLTEVLLDDKTRSLMACIHNLNLAYQHKAFNPDSEQHQQFMKTNLLKAEALQKEHPYLDLSQERAYFCGSITN